MCNTQESIPDQCVFAPANVRTELTTPASRQALGSWVSSKNSGAYVPQYRHFRSSNSKVKVCAITADAKSIGIRNKDCDGTSLREGLVS